MFSCFTTFSSHHFLQIIVNTAIFSVFDTYFLLGISVKALLQLWDKRELCLFSIIKKPVCTPAHTINGSIISSPHCGVAWENVLSNGPL